MLLQSSYEDFCRRCGRPIFKGDLFDWDKEKKRGNYCIVCFDSTPELLPCPHWALYYRRYKFSGSRKYPRGLGESSSTENQCFICGAEVSGKIEKTTYISVYSTHRHGGGIPGSNLGSEIVVCPSIDENPDIDALTILHKMYLDLEFITYKASIAQHIRRIAKINPFLGVYANAYKIITFDQCLRKHFPQEVAEIDGLIKNGNYYGTISSYTLEKLQNYIKCQKLEPFYAATLAMHVKLNNIKYLDLNALMDIYDLEYELRNDIVNHLVKEQEFY